jgi:hypothetical protein
MTSGSPRRQVSLRLAAVALMLSSGGCNTGPEPPKTYPVEGQVRLKDGTPLPGGGIEFRSTIDPSKSTFGQIKEDGTYSLYTIYGNKKVDGAMEGPHRVTITPLSKDRTATMPTEYPDLYTVKPGEKNRFDFTVTRSSARPE